MTALITGATGFVGYRLASALIGRGEAVCALVRPTSDLGRLGRLGKKLDCRVDDGAMDDLLDTFREVRPTTVFHLAAATIGSERHDEVASLVESNVAFGTRLLEAMAAVGCGSMVNTGTYWQFSARGEYGANGLYAACKHAFQDILKYYAGRRGIRALTLVLFDVYGPGDWRGKLVDHLMRASLGEVVPMTAGEQLLDLVHVDDVVAAFTHARDLLAAGTAAGPRNEVSGGGETYFVGTGRVLSVREIAALYETTTGSRLTLDWGRLPYPEHQIMRPCAAEPPLPGWRPRISLEEGFRRLPVEAAVG